VTGAAALAPRRPRELSSRWIVVEGFRLHARVASRAHADHHEPVLLVHGFGMSSRYMTLIGRLLAATRDVHAPDLPGHGRSQQPAEALGVAAMAEMLASYMEASGLSRAAVVANSLGCQVAVELAISHPGRVSRLVLIGPTIDPAAPSVMRQFVRLLASAIGERPSIVFVLLVDYLRMGPRLLRQELRAMMSHPMERRLPLVRQPVLVVRGALDRIVPQAWADRVAQLTGSSRALRIPRWGHALNFSAPRPLFDAIAGFLAEGDRG
jgi:2-hydroxy-6-oxonona-2,4-dienedioate hydrolase